MRFPGVFVLGGLLLACGGCGSELSRDERNALRERAMVALKKGIDYEELPAVRAQAVEALQRVAPDDGLPWIRAALNDEHPVVRFAACVALGSLRDVASHPALEKLADDSDPSVRAAAIFALHRLGDSRRSPELAAFLVEHADPGVRRNAAVLLGRLEEPGAIRLLARVMDTDDEGLRLQALESMALLGSAEALQQLKFSAYSGEGAQQTLSLVALSRTGEPSLADLYQARLEQGMHIETKLAAARALGMLGSDAGYKIAMKSLRFNSPRKNDKKDPPQAQIIRARQMAVHALGAIGKVDALPALGKLMNEGYNPQLQLAAAMAIVEIVNGAESRDFPVRQGPPARK